MAKKISDMIHVANLSPEAQQTRRSWLTPEAIASSLRKEGLGGEHEKYYAAVCLVRVATYLPTAEQIEIIHRILDELTAVEDEQE